MRPYWVAISAVLLPIVATVGRNVVQALGGDFGPTERFVFVLLYAAGLVSALYVFLEVLLRGGLPLLALLRDWVRSVRELIDEIRGRKGGRR